jgi:SAM-dependent methyltransferase
MSYWNELERHGRPEDFWMGHPLVRASINERVSGTPGLWPVDWFAAKFGSRLDDADVLSIGCGSGGLERDLGRRFPTARIIGVDTSDRAIQVAREEIAREQLAHVSYQCGDAWTILQRPHAWDAIFFHASLHHFDRLHELLRLVAAALQPGGLLYLDEYVGPAMREWNLIRLGLLNAAYYLLPRRARRARIVRTPRNPDDPTEAICSSDILPAVRASFEVVAQRDYGGNITALLFPNLQQAGDAAAVDRAVHRMLRMESFLLDRLGVGSYHTVLVARPRL